MSVMGGRWAGTMRSERQLYVASIANAVIPLSARPLIPLSAHGGPSLSTLSTTKHLAGTLQAELFTASLRREAQLARVVDSASKSWAFSGCDKDWLSRHQPLLHGFDLVDGVGLNSR